MAETKTITYEDALAVVKDQGAKVFETEEALTEFKSSLTTVLQAENEKLTSDLSEQSKAEERFNALSIQVREIIGNDVENDGIPTALKAAFQDSKKTDSTLDEIKKQNTDSMNALKKAHEVALEGMIGKNTELETQLSEAVTASELYIATVKKDKAHAGYADTFKKQGFKVEEKQLAYMMPTIIANFEDSISTTKTAEGGVFYVTKADGKAVYNAAGAIATKEEAFISNVVSLGFAKNGEQENNVDVKTVLDSNGNPDTTPANGESAKKDRATEAGLKAGAYGTKPFRLAFNNAYGSKFFDD